MEPSALLGYSVIPAATSSRSLLHGMSEAYCRLTVPQYLHVIFQQRENIFTPRFLRIVYPAFAVLSALAKVALSLAGTFLLSSVHPGGLFVLFVDYVGVAAWFWLMVRHSTLARPKLQYISCYLSVMTLLLLVVAIIGTLSKSWMIALEVITISHIMSTVLTLKRSSFSLSPSRLLPCSQPRGPHKCTPRYLQTPYNTWMP